MNGTNIELNQIDFDYLDKVLRSPQKQTIPKEVKNAISTKVYKSEIARVFDLSRRKLQSCIQNLLLEHPELSQHITRTYLNPPAVWILVCSELWYTDPILENLKNISAA